MREWLNTLLHAPESSQVLITVAATQGSSPRETGTHMLVSATTTTGTIGGGNLEFQAIDIARQRLSARTVGEPHLQRFALGPSLGQCCGGVVMLLFETVSGAEPCFTGLSQLRDTGQSAALISVVDGDCGNARLLVTATECHGGLSDELLQTTLLAKARDALTAHQPTNLGTVSDREGQPVQALVRPFFPSDLQILVFGAGHVGKALVPLLTQLPCEISWIDERADEFPDAGFTNVRNIASATPEYSVDDAPPGSFYLVMTHSHALDQAICERILRRGDFAYCGLIGSRAKRLKFEKRLRARGISALALQRLVCPIGVAGIDGKRPAEIAVAVAAQLLIEYGRRHSDESAPPRPIVARGE